MPMKKLPPLTLEWILSNSTPARQPDWLDTPCMIWGKFPKNGYGEIQRRVNGKKTSKYAHRAVYELAFGPVPDSMLVCHKCDVKLCVSPDHLVAGTKYDNAMDAIRRGSVYENRKGVPSCRFTLDETELLWMNRILKTGLFTRPQIAKMFGVGVVTVWRRAKEFEK